MGSNGGRGREGEGERVVHVHTCAAVTVFWYCSLAPPTRDSRLSTSSLRASSFSCTWGCGHHLRTGPVTALHLTSCEMDCWD